MPFGSENTEHSATAYRRTSLWSLFFNKTHKTRVINKQMKPSDSVTENKTADISQLGSSKTSQRYAHAGNPPYTDQPSPPTPALATARSVSLRPHRVSPLNLTAVIYLIRIVRRRYARLTTVRTSFTAILSLQLPHIFTRTQLTSRVRDGRRHPHAFHVPITSKYWSRTKNHCYDTFRIYGCITQVDKITAGHKS